MQIGVILKVRQRDAENAEQILTSESIWRLVDRMKLAGMIMSSWPDEATAMRYLSPLKLTPNRSGFRQGVKVPEHDDIADALENSALGSAIWVK